jgi:hypothetical protein
MVYVLTTVKVLISCPVRWRFSKTNKYAADKNTFIRQKRLNDYFPFKSGAGK